MVGLIIDAHNDGLPPLACLDSVQFAAPDGRILSGIAEGQRMRVLAVSPPAGTLVGRHQTVKVDVEPVSQSSGGEYRPCDWVSVDEASKYLGTGPVTGTSAGADKGSTDIKCDYHVNADTADQPRSGGKSVLSELRLTASHVVNAAAEFDFESAGGASVDGIGLAAACTSTPTPAGQGFIHRLHVLLPDERLYVATGWGLETCDILESFARTAIRRIEA